MSRNLRWGLLSTARINSFIIPALQRLDGVSLDGVASRNMKRSKTYAEDHGIPRAFGSYEDIINDPDIDCLYISVPNSLHAEWTRAALTAGKHVLCEKPLTTHPDLAAELFSLAVKKRRVLMEAFMYRHHPQTVRIRDLLRDQVIGSPQVLRMSFNFRTEDPASDVRYRPELGGGALFDVGCYCVSLATYIFDGPPSRVGGLARIANEGIDESFVGHMQFEADDALVIFDCSIRAPLDIGFTAVGIRGRLSVPTPWYPHRPPQQILVDIDGAVTSEDCRGRDSYELEIAHFCRVVNGEESPEVTAEETIRNLQTMQRLAHSASLTHIIDRC